MKKLVSLFILMTLVLSSAMAQSAHREVGSLSINAGIGLGIAGRSGYSVVLPPLKVDVDYTVLSFSNRMSLSAGGYFSLGTDRLKSYDTTVTTFLVGPMACFRYALTDSFDLFGKGIIGYLGVNTSEPMVNSIIGKSHVGAGFYVGGTWYFSSKLGLGAELGYGGPTTIGMHLTIRL